MQDWIQKLKDQPIGKIVENEPLSKHNTWKIGGPARIYIEPDNQKGLLDALTILNEAKIPWKVIGKGSNLLFLDHGFNGAIIHMNKGFNQILFDGSYIHVGASVSLIRLANLAAKQGLTGLEFAGGIPGTVGGAIYMNAGAHGSDISHVFEEAEVLLENGQIVTWKNQDFEFSYRSSILQQKRGIILSATFKLKQGNQKKIAEDTARFKDRRRKTQPYHLPCAGSVFRNPENDYAGRLIEELGLKGYQVGEAQISMMHANFIVNIGQASAKDVLTLIEHVKERVYEVYQIKLTTEIEVVGEG
ncbi:UDP-N-acetylmuramate dehydrogenase [Tepidibacillus infernus]|uniref:UDP-N-acetylmuramate dehydrogenase n=1 Tax=Tepidibacillus infernus TaxID=1806172 RepID=UPI003B691FC0